MGKLDWRRHRRSVRFIHFLPNKKAPVPTTGTRTENTFLRYHLVCRILRPLCNSANTPSALNAGNTSADTKGCSLFPLPSAAHLLPRFSLRSQLCETLCGCAVQFYFRFKGLYMVSLFNYTSVRLSRTFFHRWRKWLPKARCRAKIKKKKQQLNPYYI